MIPDNYQWMYDILTKDYNFFISEHAFDRYKERLPQAATIKRTKWLASRKVEIIENDELVKKAMRVFYNSKEVTIKNQKKNIVIKCNNKEHLCYVFRKFKKNKVRDKELIMLVSVQPLKWFIHTNRILEV